MASSAEWFDDARDEAARAAASLERGDYVYAALHSEQAAEKALKAFLLKKGATLRTHDIAALLGEARRRGLTLEAELESALPELTVHYVASRYPDARRGLGISKAHYARELAEKLLRAAEGLLSRVAEALKDPPRFGLHETGRNVDELVASYLDRLRSRLRVRGLVVYGSRARGSWKPWSDVDVLVVADELPAGFDRWRLLYSPLIDPRGYTVGELERALESLDMTVLDALAEGVIIYDDGVVARTRERLGALLQRGALLRVVGGWVRGDASSGDFKAGG